MINFQDIDSLLSRIDRLTSPKFDVLELLNHPNQIVVHVDGIFSIDWSNPEVTQIETAIADRFVSQMTKYSYQLSEEDECLTCSLPLAPGNTLFCVYHVEKNSQQGSYTCFDEEAEEEATEGLIVEVDDIVSYLKDNAMYFAKCK